MKKFLGKISIWVFPLIALHLALGYFYTDGNTDDNYRHFAVPKPNNIIMGDSRGSQGVVPSELEAVFPSRKFDNFSLNITYSPYGEIYYKALKRKLNPNTKNGIFILTVSPWTISTSKTEEGKESFTEEKSPLANMYCYDCSPNYEYLLKNYHQTWYYLYRDREEQGKSNTYLHNDGWLEVSVSMTESELKQRVKKKVQLYQKMLEGQSVSASRIKGLEDIIRYLQSRGKIYLVRIPCGEEITEIEQEYAPEFNQLMLNLAQKYSISYFDFSPQYSDYQYTDGNHLYKESSRKLTRRLADSIQHQLK